MPFPMVPGWANGMNPDMAATFEFFTSNFEQFDKRFREVKYPDLYWNQVLPAGSVDTGINPGAQSASYPTMDWRGKAGWRAKYAKNVNTVSFVTGKNRVPIESGAVSAIVDLEELEQVQFGVQLDLRTKYPEIMKKACQRHVEGTFFYGDGELGWHPFLDFPGVPTTVAGNGASGASEWESKTPDEILADMNMAVIGMEVTTRKVHTATTIYLPTAHLGYIRSTARSANSDLSILEYFKRNNPGVEVLDLPYLADAGVSGAARMIVMQKIEDNFYMPFPREFELLPPQFVDYTIKMYARYRFGAVNFVYPKAVAFVDGI